MEAKVAMVTVKDLIPEWEGMKAALQRQADMIEAGEMRSPTPLEVLKRMIGELDELLADYAEHR